MKKLKFLFVLLFCGLLFGCATGNGNRFDAYKNMTAQQILVKGKTALSKRKYKDAVKHLEALDALYPFGSEAQIGQLDIIYAYYKSKDDDSAVAAADRYIHIYPRDRHTDYAYYMKGKINLERGKTWIQRIHPSHIEQRDLTYLKQAFVDFHDLVQLFPQSKYVPSARHYMLYLRELFAQYELNVANFYLEHKAYVAAANRASNIVKHFQGTPQIKEALQIMLKSYQALGVSREAAEVQEIIRLNP